MATFANHFRTTMTGLTTAATDTTPTIGALAGTIGTPYELNVVERKSTAAVDAAKGAPDYTEIDGNSAGTKIDTGEALIIMNMCGRLAKQYLGGSYTTARVKKLILTVEMKD